MWLVAAWLVASGDSVRDAAISRAIERRRFSRSATLTRRSGTSRWHVRAEGSAGAPLGEGWLYQAASEHACALVRFAGGTVVEAREPGACRGLGIDAGASAADVAARLGTASDECWEYSASGKPAGTRAAFRLRLVCFTNARVVMVAKRWDGLLF